MSLLPMMFVLKELEQQQPIKAQAHLHILSHGHQMLGIRKPSVVYQLEPIMLPCKMPTDALIHVVQSLGIIQLLTVPRLL